MKPVKKMYLANKKLDKSGITWDENKKKKKKWHKIKLADQTFKTILAWWARALQLQTNAFA